MRPTRWHVGSVGLLCALLVTTACTDDSPPNRRDGSTPDDDRSLDGSEPTVDAAEPLEDGGNPSLDGGQEPREDAGPPDANNVCTYTWPPGMVPPRAPLVGSDLPRPKQPLFDFDAPRGGDGGLLVITGADPTMGVEFRGPNFELIRVVRPGADSRIVSDQAPAMISMIVAPRILASAGDTSDARLTLMAPALGDHIQLEGIRLFRFPTFEPAPFEVVVPDAGPGVSASRQAWVQAGPAACSQTKVTVPPDASSFGLRQLQGCDLDAGAAMAAVYDVDGSAEAYAVATLPALDAGSAVTRVELSPWLVPSPEPLYVQGAPEQAMARVWIKRGPFRLPATLGWAPGGSLSVPVPGAFAESLEAEIVEVLEPRITSSVWKIQTSHRFDYAPGATQRDYRVNLPTVTAARTYSDTPCSIEHGLEWDVDPEGEADAVVLDVSSTYRFTLCCRIENQHIVIAPTSLRRLSFAQVAAFGVDFRWEGRKVDITYFDSDRQHGYREFLREPLSNTDAFALDEQARGPGILNRTLPLGATLSARSSLWFLGTQVGN